MKNKFKIGYEPVLKKIEKSPRPYLSCFNCKYYYALRQDYDEECQNNQVLEYDMVYEGNNVYCTLWKPNVKLKEEDF